MAALSGRRLSATALAGRRDTDADAAADADADADADAAADADADSAAAARVGDIDACGLRDLSKDSKGFRVLILGV